jgi:hypothetical protein
MKTGLTVQDDQLVSFAYQDLDPIIDQTAQLRDIGRVGSSDMKHAATIPNILIEKYCNEKGITFQEWCRNPVHVKAMLNDPQNEPFRVWKGRI